MVSEARVASAQGESAEQRRAAIVDRISTIHQGIQRDLPALTAGDEAELSGKRVETLDARPPADGGKDVAVHHARDNAVPHVRDTNDRTTFISWVLRNGRHAEASGESLIDAVFNYDDYDA